MSGTLQEIAVITSVNLRNKHAVRWDVLRYLLASSMIIFMRVNDLSTGKPMSMGEEVRIPLAPPAAPPTVS